MNESELMLKFRFENSVKCRSRKIDFTDLTYHKLEKMTVDKFGGMSRIQCSIVLDYIISRAYEKYLKDGWI